MWAPRTGSAGRSWGPGRPPSCAGGRWWDFCAAGPGRCGDVGPGRAGDGRVGHDAVPAEAEPPGAFAAVVGDEAGHPLLAAHAARRRPAMRLSDAVEPRRLFHSELFGDLLHASGFEYGIAIGVRTERREAVVVGLGRSEREFSERDRDVLDLVCPGLEGALRATEARGRLVRGLAADPPRGTAVVLLDRYGEIELSSGDAERWFAEHFGAPEHPGWLPGPVAEWLALPPRPPLVAERDDRLLTISLVPGDPHALLLEEEVASVRTGALDRFGLTPRETEVLRAAEAMDDEADIAWELSSAFTASGSGARAGRPSWVGARPPTPSPARCARARRHRAAARRSHPVPAGGPDRGGSFTTGASSGRCVLIAARAGRRRGRHSRLCDACSAGPDERGP